MENKQDQGYTGIWKHIGCFLTIVVGLTFLFIALLILNRIFRIWEFDF